MLLKQRWCTVSSSSTVEAWEMATGIEVCVGAWGMFVHAVVARAQHAARVKYENFIVFSKKSVERLENGG